MTDARPHQTTTVYLPPRERRLVEIAAEARGMGPSAYLRRVALEAAERDVLAAAIKARAPQSD